MGFEKNTKPGSFPGGNQLQQAGSFRPGGGQLHSVIPGPAGQSPSSVNQLHEIIFRDLSEEDKKALDEISKRNKANLGNMFKGAKLTLKKDAGYGFHSMKNGQPSYNGGQSDSNGEASRILDDHFGFDISRGMQDMLGSEFTNTFIPAFIPFIGPFKSGGKAIVSAFKATYSTYKEKKMKDGAGSFAPGDPAAAFEAIMRIQDREIVKHLTSTSIYSASTLVQLATYMIDFGTITSIVSQSAEQYALFIYKTYLIYRDYNEIQEANTLLEQGPIDLNLFKTCPLLGCYLIGNSDTSAIINLSLNDYAKDSWKFQVEDMVARSRPVFKKSREIILKSRYTIKELENQKGSVADLTSKKGKLQSLVNKTSIMIGK